MMKFVNNLCTWNFGRARLLQIPHRFSSSFQKDSVSLGPFNFIDGAKTSSSGSETLNVIEPATGSLLCRVPVSTASEVDEAVKSSKEAFRVWSRVSPYERGKLLVNVSVHIRENVESLARLEVQNNGKPIWEARLDILSCAECFQYFGGLASAIKGSHLTLPNGSFGLVKREPLGVVAGIGAWNYPMQTCSWKVAPALACGNTFVFKPSEFTPLTALALAEIVSHAGIPNGVFNIIQGNGVTGSHLVNHEDVSKVSFTGSVATGKHIMAKAADGLKQVTLELGGKNPLIIFPDADVKEAVKGTLMANFLSQGQVCSNGTRVFVHESILEQFTEKLVDATRRLKIGDPMDEATTVGATIHQAHGDNVLAFINKAVLQGARKLCGGERVQLEGRLRNGFYISPCVLADCTDDMEAVREEIFGPVVTLLSFSSEEEVLRRANDTTMGLSAGVFTKDLRRAHYFADHLEAGYVWVNNYNVTPVELPFGGCKQSGFGRECGEEAIRYYTQTKSVYFEMNRIDCGPLYTEE